MLYAKLIPISFIILLLSFCQRNDLSNEIPIMPSLNQAPKQTPLDEKPFHVAIEDKQYLIEPQYDYDLIGMVVSYAHHNGNYGVHKRWGDHLNVADICVIWQDNAHTAQLDKLDFWNGEFTCNVQTDDNVAWASFHMNQLSNNHLLTTDDRIRDQLKAINVGDQIRIKGWLVNYGQRADQMRKTSITREDTGNGACETLYVKQVEILQPYSNLWRKLMWISLFVFIGSLFFYFQAPHRARGA